MEKKAGRTRSFRNRTGKPGFRVTLEGPDGNPEGIGAVIRMVMGSRLGPARELHAGSGFRSQDASDTVLATPETPTAVEVRWPGGRVQRHEWPKGATAVVIGNDGLRRR